MGDNNKVLKFPQKTKKESRVSKSGKGISVKPLKEDDFEDSIETELVSDKELKELELDTDTKLDLDKLEQAEIALRADRTYLQKFLGIDPEDDKIEDLQKILEKLKVRAEVREAISNLIIQQHELEEKVLNAKTSLLQKKALSQYEIQELINDIEILKLKSEKAEQEFKNLKIQNKIKELQEETKIQGKKQDYNLKDFDALEESSDSDSDIE